MLTWSRPPRCGGGGGGAGSNRTLIWWACVDGRGWALGAALIAQGAGGCEVRAVHRAAAGVPGAGKGTKGAAAG